MRKTDAQRREDFINRSLVCLFVGIILLALVIIYGIVGIPIAIFIFHTSFLIALVPLILGIVIIPLLFIGGVGISFFCS